MRILAIETSCDETGLAVINAPQNTSGTPEVLVNLVRSQVEKHAPHGGVVPSIAKREHEKVLPLLWEQAKKELGNAVKGIDMVAVTEGPGLSPCLWRGIEYALKIAEEVDAPLYGINHLKGHFYVVTLEHRVTYPALALIVSGGHTELVLAHSQGEFEILGHTVDDAAGEAFDKVARLLGLGFPGGPEISRVGQQGDSEAFDFPRPMEHSGDYNFSFAGLKTAVMYRVKGIPPYGSPLELTEQAVADVAASFQRAAVDILVQKTVAAAKEYKPRTLILGGGVAANTLLRNQLIKQVENQLQNTELILPERKHTTDNALMIALAAWQEHKNLMQRGDLFARPNLRIDEE